jgi:hypothetical protein
MDGSDVKGIRLSREKIFLILDEEVAPALQANLLYNPTPVMDGWTEEDVTRLAMKFMARKSTIIDRVVPARLLLKQRRKHIQYELNRLLSSWINALSKKREEKTTCSWYFLKRYFTRLACRLSSTTHLPDATG